MHILSHSPTHSVSFVKRLEDLQGDDFINAYTALSPAVQEIWDVRISRYRLSKLAEFIEKKFSKESSIEYKEYAALREYNSLTSNKKAILARLTLCYCKYTTNP